MFNLFQIMKRKKPREEFCKHQFTNKVIIHDEIWDQEMDNDDLEDPSTYIEVTYCKTCGKILLKQHVYPTICRQISSIPEIEEFERITKCKARNITFWKQ